MFKFSVKLSWQTPLTDPNSVCELMHCLAMVFIDEFSNFSTFSVVLLVPGRPEHSLSSTDTQLALKRECHSKTAVRLKECSPKASRSISRVPVADLLSFTENLMQTCCFILPSVADKTKHELEKALV
jgi:hypothetical protein